MATPARLRSVVTATGLVAAVLAGPTSSCDLTGLWTYAPEPGTRYNWVEKEGKIACFAGSDFWEKASGSVDDSTLTLTFRDPACPGAPAGPAVVKRGAIANDCNTVTMADVQPNCPKAGSCVYTRVPPPPPPPPPCKSDPTAALDTGWLACRTAEIIDGCKEPISHESRLNRGVNASSAYTPDATHSYGAQWTRDFFYTVSGAAELMDRDSVQRSVRYTFAGQRQDGCMPDRVQINGDSVMAPGGELPGNHRNPEHDHAWDNGPFGALLLAAAAAAWPDPTFFCELEPKARFALDFVNRSANHLVFNDVGYPNATYGFTDTVAKTGNLLFTSLAYIDASRQLAALSRAHGCGNVTQYEAEAEAMGGSIDSMKDPAGPLWLAASVDNALPDVWGSAYMVALNLSTAARRHQAMAELAANEGGKYFQWGQARSLPAPLYWTRCCWSPDCGHAGQGCAGKGTYQNGAFWATPLSYVTQAFLQTGHGAAAVTLLKECVSDFKQRGIYEDVNWALGARGVLNYTASATNVLWAAKLLNQHGLGT